MTGFLKDYLGLFNFYLLLFFLFQFYQFLYLANGLGGLAGVIKLTEAPLCKRWFLETVYQLKKLGEIVHLIQ
jgi:hypothetical protein